MNHDDMLRVISMLLLTIYAAISAAEDIKYRAISLRLSLMFSVPGLLLSFITGRNIINIITALLPGMMMWLMSILTRGAIGIGDAIYTATCAAYLGLRELGLCVACAWLLCALTALVMIAGALTGSPYSHTHKRGLPFTAYMLLPVLFTTVNGVLQVIGIIGCMHRIII